MGFLKPVLLCNFNRPEFTAALVNSLRTVKPQSLYISIDGPRAHVEADKVNCSAVLDVLQKGIDWPCKIEWLINDSNKGCQVAVSSAIDWFFSRVEEGIILEDDTLPSPDFFRYAQSMLEKYRNNQSVMHISGNNFQFGRIRGDGAFYASRFAHSWGWATWRRAWSHYDITMSGFLEEWDQIAADCSLPVERRDWWKRALSHTKAQNSTWDFQWHYAVMKNGGVCLIPNRNLVVNIGVGTAATHMKVEDVASSIRLSRLRSLYPPSTLEVCNEADQFDFDHSVTNNPVGKMSFYENVIAWRFELSQRYAELKESLFNTQ